MTTTLAFICKSTVILVLMTLAIFDCQAQEKNTAEPLVELLDFSNQAGLENWEFLDDSWKVFEAPDQKKYLSLFKKESNYQPAYRSPTHLAICQTQIGNDFELLVEAKSTHPDYGHRDVVVVIGFQNPDQYYYVHLAKAMDANAHQIFIVDRSARRKISLETTSGVAWDDQWHQIRIRREFASGIIEVFFDQSEKPIMMARDNTFENGRIGIGSFDDTADFRSVLLKQKQLP